MGVRISKRAQVLVKAHGGASSPVAIGNLSSWNFDESCAEIDVTGCADSNKQYIPGQKDAKGSFTVFSNGTDDGQTVLESAHNADSLVDVYLREDGTGSGLPQKVIPAYLTSYSKQTSVDAGIELSISFVAGGAVDNTAQSGSTVTVSPASSNFTKAAAANVAVTLSGQGDVTGLTLAGDYVPVDEYTVSSNTLTIKKEYLQTLANATYNFVARCTNGNATIVITVGA